MGRPFSYPTPKFHNGEKTLSVRFSVDGKNVKRSCGTADMNVAKRRVPGIVEKARSAPAAAVAVAMPIEDLEATCLRFRAELVAALKAPPEKGATFADRLAYRIARTQAAQILQAASVRVATTTDEVTREALTFTLQDAVREYSRQWQAWDAAAIGIAADNVRQSASASSSTAAPLLSSVVESFLADRKIEGDYANEHKAIVRDLTLIVGDRPVTAYGKEDARKLKDVLATLPANWTKLKALRHLPINQAAEKAKELGYKPLAPKSVAFKRAMLSAIFEYADADYDGVQNPFKNSKGWPSNTASATDQKDAFKRAELDVLLASDLPKELHWLTWLGLLTGARLNELCQLTTDLIEPTRVHFSRALRLKTAKKKGSSVRSVPLHPHLAKLGLLEFAAKADGKLFPDLPMHRSGKFSDAPSKAFRRHLEAIGLKRDGLSFHSLRHTFAHEFRRVAPTDVETRERLMGHHVVGVAGRYGGKYESEANDMDLLAARSVVVGKLFPWL